MLVRWLAVAMVALAASAASAQTPTPVPCGPLQIEVTDAATCARYGWASAPCWVKCGRLCWKPARAIWEWRQDAKGCPQFPMPTPTPGLMPCNPPACRMWGTGTCMNPCPNVTPSPRPSPTMSLLPTPSPSSPCDRGDPNWCLTWNPATDTVICARCR